VAKKRSLNATTIIDDFDENLIKPTANSQSNGFKTNKNNVESTKIFQNLNIIQPTSISFPKFSLPKTLKKVRL
jgi:hypothetical protein